MTLISYEEYPQEVAEDIVRLRRRLDAPDPPRLPVPAKVTDQNLLIATWNIQSFGRIFESFEENPESPKRNLRGLAYIAEIIRRFDIIAIQELKRDTTAIRLLLERFLGPDWDVLFSDVTAGSPGNRERLAYIWDRRRAEATGVAGELVLPAAAGEPQEQFDRTPYMVGFRSCGERFVLLTAHIRFQQPSARLQELQAFAEFTASEIRDRSSSPTSEERNLIVLGDFNIDARGDNPLFQAFVQHGFNVPPALRGLKTTSGREDKFYDQIAWFMGALDLNFSGNAGVVDFDGAVYRDLRNRRSLPSRLSDHYPLWAEFIVDRSTEQIASVLDLPSSVPDPFAAVPD